MVPPPQAYFEPINWHRTALHELGHASGHPSRLGRDLGGVRSASKKYAFEELVAEMNAAFCCASLGIVPTVRHADYIGSWLEVLREDNRAIVRAAAQARRRRPITSLAFSLAPIRSRSPPRPTTNRMRRDGLAPKRKVDHPCSRFSGFPVLRLGREILWGRALRGHIGPRGLFS